ncbi:hypothetical protein CC1G_12365 [Coprinopsis cinerea okayama7|uniref:Uncharacterized protein n=1 Tax=Coprinopsis cinerea (strain Okayama-7 / 130 / ATCC MYA-4618 / FGSC 9003) TaxID=240176 RepID=A8P576_COPC7|nr:hypothetical protein CC1G_12365 [Coprinopsis cinerea okayama7\|eukprot:XP_001838891.2 hypothetical protein CC1G_12365 [Coprinopsis cinerea okayama7\
MSYQILGRAIKNEYLALGTFASAFGLAFLSTRGGDKQAPPTTVQQAKAEVPINAGSKYVYFNPYPYPPQALGMRRNYGDGGLTTDCSIKKFLAEAEKEGAGASH